MPQLEFCDRRGSLALCDQLKSYWALRCGDLEAAVIRTVTPCTAQDSAIGNHHHRYDVRSDMINGTPRGFVWRFDATRPKGKRWRLERDERAGTVEVSQAVVGQPDTGATQSARSKNRGRASQERSRSLPDQRFYWQR